MTRQTPRMASILEDLGFGDRNLSLMAVGMSDSELPGVDIKQAFESLSGADELPQSLRAELGIVLAPLDFMSRSSAEQLLSRLRDVHCDKVLLFDTDGGWKPDELRSLGFLEVKPPPIDGRCYLFDPDSFNQPRDWNNPSDWAHPQNFRKYRW